MKLPKFILRIGFQEFAVPHNSGLATLMGLLEDALPINADLNANTIEVQYMDEDDACLLASATMVSIKRIPPGVKWTRKNKEGHVEVIRPVAIEPGQKKQPPAKSNAKRLNGRAPLQLEFGR